MFQIANAVHQINEEIIDKEVRLIGPEGEQLGIMSAQKARGADFTNGSLIKRVKMLMPVLIPLFASALRRADELATAMECRCYHGGDGRTRMNIPHIRKADIAALIVMLVFCAALVLLNSLKFGYVMK